MSPVKEPHYFTFDGEVPIFAGPKGDHFRRVSIVRPRDYLSLFAGAASQKVIGEASTTYLNAPAAAARLKVFSPGAKIVALLRQPADRAYSHYQYLKSQGVEPSRSFAEAISEERKRKAQGWFWGHLYQEGGYYHANLSRYFDLFPREQIRVYLYEEWNRTPLIVIKDLFSFLGIDGHFVPEIYRNNVTLHPRSYWLNRLARNPDRIESALKPLPSMLRSGVIAGLQRINRKFNLFSPPPIDPDFRRQLTAEYREDILKTQDIIERDLTHWLTL
jgi:hypothetical protein